MSDFPCEFCRKADGVHASTCFVLQAEMIERLHEQLIKGYGE